MSHQFFLGRRGGVAAQAVALRHEEKRGCMLQRCLFTSISHLVRSSKTEKRGKVIINLWILALWRKLLYFDCYPEAQSLVGSSLIHLQYGVKQCSTSYCASECFLYIKESMVCNNCFATAHVITPSISTSECKNDMIRYIIANQIALSTYVLQSRITLPVDSVVRTWQLVGLAVAASLRFERTSQTN